MNKQHNTTRFKKGQTPWNKGKSKFSSSLYHSVYANQNKKKVLCKCGCGILFDNKDKYGRIRVYIHGHNKGHTGYKGKPAWNKGKTGVYSPETLKKMVRFGRVPWNKGLTYQHGEAHRLARSRQIFPQTDTKIELAIQKLLRDNKIDFIKHKVIKIGKSYHQVDMFIEPNICVECDGTYWHSRPIQIERDKIIDYELHKLGYIVIRLPESKIKNDLRWCLNEIIIYLNALSKLSVH